MNKDELKSRILELCSEDNYGVWEFWWDYSARKNPEMDLFIEVISELNGTGQIIALDKNGPQFRAATLSTDRLRREIALIKAGDVPDEAYWFGKAKE